MIDVSVSGLVKSFEIGSNILDGLSFQVEAGERVGILGPNGCGTTTLFTFFMMFPLTSTLSLSGTAPSTARALAAA